MSILSDRTDGTGCYYGFYETDPRQINVRLEDFKSEKGGWSAPAWVAYVGGVAVATELSKGEAERAAIKWIRQNPQE